MSIQVQRVFVKETGGRLPHNTPSGGSYDLVIEATADAGDGGKVYQLLCAVRNLTAPTILLPAAMSSMHLSNTTVGDPNWTQIGAGRRELIWVIHVAGLGAGVEDHLIKYSVVLRDNANHPDADGAESELFTIA
jgi:hypothetical protein